MDPDACLRDMLDAVDNGDWPPDRGPDDGLARWVLAGGQPPGDRNGPKDDWVDAPRRFALPTGHRVRLPAERPGHPTIHHDARPRCPAGNVRPRRPTLRDDRKRSEPPGRPRTRTVA